VYTQGCVFRETKRIVFYTSQPPTRKKRVPPRRSDDHDALRPADRPASLRPVVSRINTSVLIILRRTHFTVSSVVRVRLRLKKIPCGCVLHVYYIVIVVVLLYYIIVKKCSRGLGIFTFFTIYFTVLGTQWRFYFIWNNCLFLPRRGSTTIHFRTGSGRYIFYNIWALWLRIKTPPAPIFSR